MYFLDALPNYKGKRKSVSANRLAVPSLSQRKFSKYTRALYCQKVIQKCDP